MKEPRTNLSRMEPRDKPDVALMIREIEDAIYSANALGIFKKLEVCHHTRKCWWTLQQDDGRKPEPRKGSKENLYWWEGSPETRYHKADEIVLERAGIRELVLHRGEVTISPSMQDMAESDEEQNGPDEEDIEAWQLTLDFFKRNSETKLNAAWSLFSSCVEEFGYGIIQAGWEECIRNDKRIITVAQLTQFITSKITSDLFGPDFDASQLPPEQAQAAAAEVQMQSQMALFDALATPDVGIMWLTQIDPDISPSEAKIAIKELAEKGEASYFAPSSYGGMLMPQALVPWVNFVHSSNLGMNGRAEWGAVPEWVDEQTLRSAGRGYRKSWVDLTLEHPNESMPAMLSVSLDNQYQWVLNGGGIGLKVDSNYFDKTHQLFMILHVWRKAVDRDGRITVFRTVISPFVKDDYGAHEGTGLAECPFLIETSEPVIHAMLSRGVGEIVVAAQNQVIDLMDSEGARAQLGSNPPLLRSMNNQVPVRPGMQMHERSVGTGNRTEFMRTPPVDGGSLKLIELAERFVDQRFFRAATTDPDTKQQMKELLAIRAMQSLSSLWKMLFNVIQANVTALRVSHIAGRPVNLSVTGEQLQGEVDIQISFNVAGLGNDSATSYMDLVKELLAIDPGIIDRSALIRDALTMKNPVMAKRLLLSDERAADQIRGDQQLRISKIMGGWKPTPQDFPQRQTNPQMRLEVMGEYTNDQWNQQRLNDPRNADAMQIMQQEMQYLQAQVTQYTTNVATGRSVVKPKTSEDLAPTA